jgi:CRP-like cAMP-binding protein
VAATRLQQTASNGGDLTRDLLRQNVILRGLEESVAADVLGQCKLVNLKLRQKIYEPEQRITDVYFPLESVLSVVTRMEDGSQIEIGTIGREGMSAFPLLMGASTTANDSFCQVRGSAIVMSADLFRELKDAHSGFRQLLDRYLQAYVNMLGQLAACNRLHTVYERCARWLLMTFDRVGLEEIPLTHEYLAMMLGTGRSGVTIAAATLQQAGFITYGHGNIRIHNRAGLADAACECYAVSRKQFGGLLRQINGNSSETKNLVGARSASRKIAKDGRADQKVIEGDF